MPIGSRLSPIVCKSVRPPEALEAIVELDLTDLAGVRTTPAATAPGLGKNANEKSDATHPSSADHERI